LWQVPPNSVVCAYAIDIPAGGPATRLGCRDLSKPSPKDPIGNFDGAYAAPGQIHLIGWAGDPDGKATTLLRVYYDGPYPTFLTQPVLEPTASLPRPDVRAAFPRLSATTGFDLTLPITPGVHTICLRAQNTGPSGTHNADLGCVHGTIPDSPPPGLTTRAGASTGSGRVRSPAPHRVVGTRPGGPTTRTRPALSPCACARSR
jgi:hypothetical protein